jgi:hypothetical protein
MGKSGHNIACTAASNAILVGDQVEGTHFLPDTVIGQAFQQKDGLEILRSRDPFK